MFPNLSLPGPNRRRIKLLSSLRFCRFDMVVELGLDALGRLRFDLVGRLGFDSVGRLGFDMIKRYRLCMVIDYWLWRVERCEFGCWRRRRWFPIRQLWLEHLAREWLRHRIIIVDDTGEIHIVSRY